MKKAIRRVYSVGNNPQEWAHILENELFLISFALRHMGRQHYAIINNEGQELDWQLHDGYLECHSENRLTKCRFKLSDCSFEFDEQCTALSIIAAEGAYITFIKHK